MDTDIWTHIEQAVEHGARIEYMDDNPRVILIGEHLNMEKNVWNPKKLAIDCAPRAIFIERVDSGRALKGTGLCQIASKCNESKYRDYSLGTFEAIFNEAQPTLSAQAVHEWSKFLSKTVYFGIDAPGQATQQINLQSEGMKIVQDLRSRCSSGDKELYEIVSASFEGNQDSSLLSRDICNRLSYIREQVSRKVLEAASLATRIYSWIEREVELNGNREIVMGQTIYNFLVEQREDTLSIGIVEEFHLREGSYLQLALQRVGAPYLAIQLAGYRNGQDAFEYDYRELKRTGNSELLYWRDKQVIASQKEKVMTQSQDAPLKGEIKQLEFF